MKYAVIVLFILAVGCSGYVFFAQLSNADQSPNSELPSDRDLELAALHNIDLPFSSAYFPKPDAELDRTQQWINEKRTWLLTIEDKRVRKAYAHWIDYAQTRLNENREENQTHVEQLAYETRTKARDNEWARGRATANTIPKPQ